MSLEFLSFPAFIHFAAPRYTNHRDDMILDYEVDTGSEDDTGFFSAWWTLPLADLENLGPLVPNLRSFVIRYDPNCYTRAGRLIPLELERLLGSSETVGRDGEFTQADFNRLLDRIRKAAENVAESVEVKLVHSLPKGIVYRGMQNPLFFIENLNLSARAVLTED